MSRRLAQSSTIAFPNRPNNIIIDTNCVHFVKVKACPTVQSHSVEWATLITRHSSGIRHKTLRRLRRRFVKTFTSDFFFLAFRSRKPNVYRFIFLVSPHKRRIHVGNKSYVTLRSHLRRDFSIFVNGRPT